MPNRYNVLTDNKENGINSISFVVCVCLCVCKSLSACASLFVGDASKPVVGGGVGEDFTGLGYLLASIPFIFSLTHIVFCSVLLRSSLYNIYCIWPASLNSKTERGNECCRMNGMLLQRCSVYGL
jgi:hypothetical protein